MFENRKRKKIEIALLRRGVYNKLQNALNDNDLEVQRQCAQALKQIDEMYSSKLSPGLMFQKMSEMAIVGVILKHERFSTITSKAFNLFMKLFK